MRSTNPTLNRGRAGVETETGADWTLTGPIGTFRLAIGRWSITLWLMLGVASAGASGGSLPASEFSADIVSRDAGGVSVGSGARLYVANRMVRIETPEASAGFFLIDGAAGTALFVRPTQQVFMDAKQSTRLTQIFVPVDPNDPCRQWQAAAKNAGVPSAGGDWRCGRGDTAIVDGRPSIEYGVVSPDRQWSRGWIDSDLQFPIKLLAADGTTIALEHIRVEAQPASLFAKPPGYRKSEPQALIERIRHSDVWVETPSP
jgi:hypothetical protein